MADIDAAPHDGDGGKPAEIPGSGDTPDVGAAHPTGAEQAAINQEDDPPA